MSAVGACAAPAAADTTAAAALGAPAGTAGRAGAAAAGAGRGSMPVGRGGAAGLPSPAPSSAGFFTNAGGLNAGRRLLSLRGGQRNGASAAAAASAQAAGAGGAASHDRQRPPSPCHAAKPGAADRPLTLAQPAAAGPHSPCCCPRPWRRRAASGAIGDPRKWEQLRRRQVFAAACAAAGAL